MSRLSVTVNFRMAPPVPGTDRAMHRAEVFLGTTQMPVELSEPVDVATDGGKAWLAELVGGLAGALLTALLDEGWEGVKTWADSQVELD